MLTRQLLDISYDHAKAMSVEQMNSLVQIDHDGILHETNHPDKDEHWNLKARTILEHREKTRKDQGVIAKSRRIRKKLAEHERKRLARVYEQYRPYDLTGRIADALVNGFQEGCKNAYDRVLRERATSGAYANNYDAIDWNKKPKRKIPQRINPWPPKGSRKLRTRSKRVRRIDNASTREPRHSPPRGGDL